MKYQKNNFNLSSLLLLFLTISSCSEPIPGCLDPEAFNYNKNATVSDSSCVEKVYGCLNSAALNYNSKANIDDNSCINKILGCTDENSMNFSPKANVNDGSCLPACVSPNYNNYQYKVVAIGDQCWFAENLRTTNYTNGDPITLGKILSRDNLEQGLCYNFITDYQFSYKSNEKYGCLYNKYAVLDSRGICPKGWHVATTNDWNELKNYILNDKRSIRTKNNPKLFWGGPGMTLLEYDSWWADYQKELNPKYNDGDHAFQWKNVFGFSILPAGRFDGSILKYDESGGSGGGGKANFWSIPAKEKFDNLDAHYIFFDTTPLCMKIIERGNRDGFSCRCIRD